MATASLPFKSREDHRNQLQLEEARKAGLEPPALDEDGNAINPHIPQYMADAPWYLKFLTRTLKHQKNWKGTRKEDNCCGSMTHNAKSCMERPRKKGAKRTNMYIMPDELIETIELDYEGKRDRWNGFDPSTYARVIDEYEARDEARKNYLKEEQLKNLEDKNNSHCGDEAVDESEQVGYAKLEKRVRTTGDGSTGTVRNLRIREDIAKYLLNLDVNSAYYDPKTRSMREDPNPESDPNEKFYEGDNKYRKSGQAAEFNQLVMHTSEAYEKGHDAHMQAAPSQAELLHKIFMDNKQKLKSKTKDTIMEKYGNAATEEDIPRELLHGQSESQVEMQIPRSKYEEDIYINNHTTVWGSWWKDSQWGFKCCKQSIKNSYCTGAAGIEAAEATTNLMKDNIARKEASEDKPAAAEEKKLASWGTDVPEDLILDPKRLNEALKKEDKRRREERDERKRKYNVKYNDEVTAEDMEAYRMKKVRHADPMKEFV
ncbi:hypothetical protein MKX03_024730 [Papaver bracteatum]|nr:hypothetical protein MKX03_024730 [Papaver bracteatum]